mmetsp:Transcript_173898/g.557376  ORF Transcript_173898/g.557376 Transcript_173898/m.557376 type:complete len:250 (+) Transcript_173898:779-1528(+)
MVTLPCAVTSATPRAPNLAGSSTPTAKVSPAYVTRKLPRPVDIGRKFQFQTSTWEVLGTASAAASAEPKSACRLEEFANDTSAERRRTSHEGARGQTSAMATKARSPAREVQNARRLRRSQTQSLAAPQPLPFFVAVASFAPPQRGGRRPATMAPARATAAGAETGAATDEEEPRDVGSPGSSAVVEREDAGRERASSCKEVPLANFVISAPLFDAGMLMQPASALHAAIRRIRTILLSLILEGKRHKA